MSNFQHPISKIKKEFITAPIAIILSLIALGVGVYTEVSKRQVVAEFKTAEVSDDDLFLYTNERLGFSMLVPKKTDIWLYRSETLTYGIEQVPTKVFDDGKSNYVYLSTLYRGSNYRDPITQTFDLIEKDPQYGGWKINFLDILNDEDLLAFAKDYYGEGCEIIEKVPSKQEGIFDVSFSSTLAGANLETDTCRYGYVLSVVKYSSDFHKIAFWSGGSDYSFVPSSYPSSRTELMFE